MMNKVGHHYGTGTPRKNVTGQTLFNRSFVADQPTEPYPLLTLIEIKFGPANELRLLSAKHIPTICKHRSYQNLPFL